MSRFLIYIFILFLADGYNYTIFFLSDEKKGTLPNLEANTTNLLGGKPISEGGYGCKIDV